jgi:tetratricopeptide (TPR) repeat protein
VHEGYPHFVARSGGGLEATIVHELTHACLASLRLPLWVEEGVTQLVEQEVEGEPGPLAEPRRLLRLRGYWRRKGLHDFWHGAGFRRAGRAQPASYNLALVLAHKLLERDRDLYRRFLLAARREDCGDSALREVFHLAAGDLAASFLGEGDWKPVPGTGPELAARGWLLQERGEYSGAVIDLRAALQKDSEDAEALNTLAWVLATCPDAAVRDGSEAVALARRACELTNWSWEPGLDTLAAALAEAGDFAGAVEIAGKAVALAAPEVRAECEARLEIYRTERPFRDAPPVES